MGTLHSIIKGHAIRLSGHVVHHSKKVGTHFKKHHKKYIFGAIGGAVLFKAITLIIAGIGINYSMGNGTFANNEGEYCYLTGQYLAGGYETGCYLTGQYLTEGTMTGCYMEGQELTGGYTDEAGNFIEQYLEGGYLTGCYMEGQELTGGYLEGCYMEGQELTGGYMVCESESGSLVDSGNNPTPENNTTCLNSELNVLSPLSGAIAGGEIPINREYCSESQENITIQLFDHNAQWIDIATVAYDVTGIKFDTKLLSTGYILSGSNYGMYHIIGQNTQGEDYYIFTGNYTGNYVTHFSQYKIRFIQNGNNLFTTDYTFTIDNQSPTTNLIGFNVTPTYTGKAYLNSIVEVIIQSSESLSGVSFLVNDYAGGVTVTQSGTIYKIYQTLSSNNISGIINYTLQYYDLAGNVGLYSSNSNITFIPSNYTSTGTITSTGSNTGNITTNTGTNVVNTGNNTGASFGFVLMNEIEKFNNCKKAVSYKELKLQIHGSTHVLQMPEFQKSYVKKIINAFTLVVLSNIEKNKNLTKPELDAITNKFNNFLIVLKLVRDNNNACKQSLSNYHINEFRNIIQKYNLYSD